MPRKNWQLHRQKNEYVEVIDMGCRCLLPIDHSKGSMLKHIHPAQGVNYFFHAIHMRVDGLYIGLQSLDRLCEQHPSLKHLKTHHDQQNKALTSETMI